MSKPILLVIAGCNGSGKSSFSNLLASDEFEPFDYDYHYLKIYTELFDSELRGEMAHNMAFSTLENKIQYAIKISAMKPILIQPLFIGPKFFINTTLNCV